jgi:hypothetical protein
MPGGSRSRELFRDDRMGRCRTGWKLRRYQPPESTSGSGGSYLNCHRLSSDVFWVEAGE